MSTTSAPSNTLGQSCSVRAHLRAACSLAWEPPPCRPPTDSLLAVARPLTQGESSEQDTQLLKVSFLPLHFFLPNAFYSLTSIRWFTLAPEVVLRNPGSILYALRCGSSSWCDLSLSLAQFCSSQQDKASREGPCCGLSHDSRCYLPWPCCTSTEQSWVAGRNPEWTLAVLCCSWTMRLCSQWVRRMACETVI